ncbi:hypothetical protein ACQE3D_16200 [Methylomonas sp. MS20]|uniref:hypothetical protein n=1 Tax=unclassified Methylomonas TaxID=2608980 RepID=UPI0028A38E69|nr:hypothetical protein [Methylomonas sp. MV1]MDT4331091.1 hypothetical protein [Methylomonas sp. MV1]
MPNIKYVLLFLVASILANGCASFGIYAPKDLSTIKLPAAARIDIKATPSIDRSSVKLDVGTVREIDITHQVPYISDSERTGSMQLPAGKHTITAEADVPCWYCSPNPTHFVDTANICVAPETWPAGQKNYTLINEASGAVMGKTANDGLEMTADSGSPASRWDFMTVYSIQQIGMIASVDNACLCLRVGDSNQIDLAICDSTDRNQLWEAMPVPNDNAFVIRNVNNFSCLTQVANNSLGYFSCDANPNQNQNWKPRNNNLGRIEQPF